MKNKELPDAARIIPLEGVLNVRELGGLPLKDGRTVRCGRLIRSGRLSDLTNLDCRILENRWNVTEIVDLRDDQEVREHPDPPLRQATLRPSFVGARRVMGYDSCGLSLYQPADKRVSRRALSGYGKTRGVPGRCGTDLPSRIGTRSLSGKVLFYDPARLWKRRSFHGDKA